MSYIEKFVYTENDCEKRRRRKYIWYQRWHHLAKLVKQNAPTKDILLQIYRMIDDGNQHGYAWIAKSSLKSLNLACEDCTDCETCKDKFQCWTTRGHE